MTVILKKTMLTGAMSIIGNGSSAQLSIGFLIVLFNMMLILKLGPFIDTADDALSFLSSLQMLFTLFGGLLIKTDNPAEPTYDPAFMGLVLIAMSILPFFAMVSLVSIL